MASGAKVKGLVEMQRKIGSYAKKYATAFAEAQFEETVIEAEECAKITPFDHRENAPHPGQLRESVHATRPFIAKTITTKVVAGGTDGGADIHYAILQHETEWFAHQEPEQWKYIESVLFASAPYMLARINKRLKSMI